MKTGPVCFCEELHQLRMAEALERKAAQDAQVWGDFYGDSFYGYYFMDIIGYYWIIIMDIIGYCIGYIVDIKILRGFSHDLMILMDVTGDECLFCW